MPGENTGGTHPRRVRTGGGTDPRPGETEDRLSRRREAFMAGAIITAILMKKHFKNQNDKRM